MKSTIARSILLCGLTGILGLLGIACEQKQRGPARRDQPIRILCIAPSTDDAVWPVVEASAQSFMSRFQDVQIDVIAPTTRSPTLQLEVLKTARPRQAQAVCILPIDPSAIRSAVSEISVSGISVVVVGWDVPGDRRDAYCGPSQIEMGRAAAQACEIVLKDRSRTVMLLHAGMDHELYGRRYHGFKHEAPFSGPLEIIREVDCGADRYEAVRLVRSVSRRYPRIGCWVFLDDWPLRDLRPDEQLLPLGVSIVMCGADPRHWPRLRNGEIQALIAYDVQEAVEAAFFRCVRLVTGEAARLEREITIPSEIITYKELPQLERRWEAWRLGQRSPRDEK